MCSIKNERHACYAWKKVKIDEHAFMACCNLSLTSSSDSTNLSVPKLRDDGSNWSDYQPRIERAMGSKGLWRHVLGNAIALKLYMLLNGAFVLSDGKTNAMEEQVESKETKIADFEKKEYLAQHILLSTTSTRLGSKIKELKSSKEMWDIIVADVTTKSTLYLLGAEEQLTSMKLVDNEDPKTHLAEMKQHFQSMIQCHENLIKMGLLLSDIVTTSTDSGFTAMIGYSQYLIMPKHLSKELAEPMNIN